MVFDLADPVVSPERLAPHLADPQVRVCDARWAPAISGGSAPSGLARYQQGHLPGAAFVDLDRDLSQPGGPGRHPLPSPEAFAQLLVRLGVGPTTEVVVYDDAGGSLAARFWFLLRVSGHARVWVLDGGIQAWTAQGRPLTQEVPAFAPAATRAISWDPRRLLDREAVIARGSRDLLFDARAPERYRGEVEPIDPVAGHIPGAINAPFAANLDGHGRLKPASALRDLYGGLGVSDGTQVIASCGSGVTACHTLLALERAGLSGGRLYVGSWSDWCRRPKATIARGPTPSGQLEALP